MGANTASKKLPPHIVFKRKNIWDTWLAKKDYKYTEMTYSATKNAWMEAEPFENYFKNSVLKNIPQRRLSLDKKKHSHSEASSPHQPHPLTHGPQCVLAPKNEMGERAYKMAEKELWIQSSKIDFRGQQKQDYTHFVML